MDKSVVLPIQASELSIERAGRSLIDVSTLDLQAGKRTAIIGPNGAGKSLLIKTLAGLQATDSGKVLWAGADPKQEHRRKVGLLLQRPVLLRRTALANVVYALRAAGLSDASAKAKAVQVLKDAGLTELAYSSARVLSSGEQQRLALARALALEPEVLFLDEPTASVDPISTHAIEQMLFAASEKGCTSVLVSHDLGQVRRFAERVIMMYKGGIVEHSAADSFFEGPSSEQGRAYLAGELLL